jgi:hypothetical protein
MSLNDLDLPFQKDIETVAGLAFPEDQLTRGELDLGKSRFKVVDSIVRQRRK